MSGSLFLKNCRILRNKRLVKRNILIERGIIKNISLPTKKRKKTDKKAYDDVKIIDVKDKVVLFKRDPAVHRQSIEGHYPVVHTGYTIRINPTITGGYGADFDGDSVDCDVLLKVYDKRNRKTYSRTKDTEIGTTTFFELQKCGRTEKILC